MLTAVDRVIGVSVSFPDLTPDSTPEELKANLTMPEPCPFINRNLPPCSVIRPTETKDIAKGVVKFLADMGLFIGQSPAFFAFTALSRAAVDLLYRQRSGELEVDIPLIISNHPDNQSIAAFYRIPYVTISVTKNNKHESEETIRELLRKAGADFIVLAR